MNILNNVILGGGGGGGGRVLSNFPVPAEAVVSHAPDSFGKESGNFSRVSVCRKNAI